MTTKTHQPCPCGKSSDACTYFLDTDSAYCHSCGDKFNNVSTNVVNDAVMPPKYEEKVEPSANSKSGNKPVFTPLAEVFRAWPERGLSKETIQTYKVDLSGGEGIAKYPRFNKDWQHVGNKVRLQAKKDRAKGAPFIYEGDKSQMTLFGMHAFEPGGAKYLTIVEGQDDAMAAYQMMGSKYPVISIDGASSAAQDIKDNFEWINSFDNIVIAFDNDEPGKLAAKSIINLPFPLGKLKIMTPRKHKDANDYLMAKDAEAWTREWWQAPSVKPDGLKLGPELWGEIIDRKDAFTVPYPMEGLNELTYGLRLSELVVITADPKIGKTSLLKKIEHSLLTNEELIKRDYGVGFMHFEEPNGDTALGLLSIHNGVPYHLPDVERPEADLKKAYDEVLNNNRVVIWDHFGSNKVEDVINKVRHMASLGCKYIVIDHLSIIVSDQSGDERKQLDEITTKLKTLTMQLDICIIAVIHTNRNGQIRGTAGVEQLANIVIRLERDKLDPNEWRRNVTKLIVTENRFCGYTGPACHLWYNKDTAIMTELDEDQVAVFENKGSINEADLPW